MFSVYVAVVSLVAFGLYKKFRSVESDDFQMEEKLRKVKEDPACSWIDSRDFFENFEFLGKLKYSFAANDEAFMSFDATPMQDVDPKDEA